MQYQRKMEKITIKTDHIRTEVDFESSVVHLSNCLAEVRSTCVISPIETELYVKFNNQKRQVSTILRKESTAVGEHPIAQCKKRAKKYWKLE